PLEVHSRQCHFKIEDRSTAPALAVTGPQSGSRRHCERIARALVNRAWSAPFGAMLPDAGRLGCVIARHSCRREWVAAGHRLPSFLFGTATASAHPSYGCVVSLRRGRQKPP